MNLPLVFVIILNWNGIKDTLECLESIYQIQYDNFIVVVVDNGSNDDSCIKIKNNYPTLKLIENDSNLGFAEGNNVGIRYALDHGADYVFLLNNDTIVDPQIITELLAAAKMNNGNGIYGSRIYYYYEPDRIWYSGANWNDQQCHFSHVIDDVPGVVETDYACGCAMFVSSSTLETIGLMDPDFFLTYEETDWCFRALRSGVKSYCVPTAKVWHKISTSFGGSTSPLMIYYLSRNLLLWAERHLGRFSYCKVLYFSFKRLVWLSQLNRKEPLFNFWLIRIVEVTLKHLLGKECSSAGRACFMGIRDYVLRRFGNCPVDTF